MELDRGSTFKLLTTYKPSDKKDSSYKISNLYLSLDLDFEITIGNLDLSLRYNATVSEIYENYYQLFSSSGSAFVTKMTYNNLEISDMPTFLSGLRNLSFTVLADEIEKDYNSVIYEPDAYLNSIDLDYLYNGKKRNFNSLSPDHRELISLEDFVQNTFNIYPCNPYGAYDRDLSLQEIDERIKLLKTKI